MKLVICVFALCFIYKVSTKNKCYSCATTNMQQGFLTKERGPRSRIAEPRTFDGNCNSDTWIIKERSTDECDGPCFKWQQILNNSGSYSYMTMRSCYTNMFNMNDPNTFRPPNHSYCTVGEVPLTCLSDASVIEYSCWCEGDFCNYVSTSSYIISLLLLCLTLHLL